jgi:hypothetical protein
MSKEISFRWKQVDSKKFGRILLPIVDVEIKSKSGEWKVISSREQIARFILEKNNFYLFNLGRFGLTEGYLKPRP